MQWDDLRFVLAVQRTGTLAGAARALRVSHVTVFRRIEAAEKELGVRLFNRKRHGYAPTPAALEIAAQAADMETRIKALEQKVLRFDSKVQGSVRIATTDTFAVTILPPVIAAMRTEFPGIEVRLLVANEVADIAHHDAEIAVRPTRRPPETLVGHKVATLGCGVYAARGAARRRPLEKQPWVSVDEGLGWHRFPQWIRARGYEPRVVMRSNTFLGAACAVRAGVGVGLMSCCVAEGLGGMTRISPLLDEIASDLWVLVHPELRGTARVLEVYTYLRKVLAARRREFAGAA